MTDSLPQGVPIVAGHSHCTALGVPLMMPDGASGLAVLTNADSRFVGFSGAWPRAQTFWEELAKVAGGRTVVLLWQGSQHYSNYLLSPGRAVDFVLYEEPGLPVDSSAELVPDLAVHDQFAEGILELDEAIRTLRAGGAARVLVSGTPPPRGNQELVRRGVFAEAYHFRVVAEQLGVRLEEVPLAEPLLMYKMWRVIQRHLIAAAERQNAEFVPVNPAAQRQGFLRDELAAGDATHANAEYGRLALDHLHAYLETPRG